MNASVYVTGTDTGIGKTHVSRLLIRNARSKGAIALGMKPVASGCRMSLHGLRNEDAETLRASGSIEADYHDINPYAFGPPIAPHIAAMEVGVEIELDTIESAYRRLASRAELVVIEGVGGWAAPLGETLTQADLVRTLDVGVVLVVGIRLGCINHALLTVRAIEADGCRLDGWIANCIDPEMLRVEANLDSLRSRIAAPLLEVVAYAPGISE